MSYLNTSPTHIASTLDDLGAICAKVKRFDEWIRTGHNLDVCEESLGGPGKITEQQLEEMIYPIIGLETIDEDTLKEACEIRGQGSDAFCHLCQLLMDVKHPSLLRFTLSVHEVLRHLAPVLKDLRYLDQSCLRKVYNLMVQSNPAELNFPIPVLNILLAVESEAVEAVALDPKDKRALLALEDILQWQGLMYEKYVARSSREGGSNTAVLAALAVTNDILLHMIRGVFIVSHDGQRRWQTRNNHDSMRQLSGQFLDPKCPQALQSLLLAELGYMCDLPLDKKNAKLIWQLWRSDRNWKKWANGKIMTDRMLHLMPMMVKAVRMDNGSDFQRLLEGWTFVANGLPMLDAEEKRGALLLASMTWSGLEKLHEQAQDDALREFVMGCLAFHRSIYDMHEEIAEDYIAALNARNVDLDSVIDRELQHFAAVLDEFATDTPADIHLIRLFFTAFGIVYSCMNSAEKKKGLSMPRTAPLFRGPMKDLATAAGEKLPRTFESLLSAASAQIVVMSDFPGFLELLQQHLRDLNCLSNDMAYAGMLTWTESERILARYSFELKLMTSAGYPCGNPGLQELWTLHVQPLCSHLTTALSLCLRLVNHTCDISFSAARTMMLFSRNLQFLDDILKDCPNWASMSDFALEHYVKLRQMIENVQSKIAANQHVQRMGAPQVLQAAKEKVLAARAAEELAVAEPAGRELALSERTYPPAAEKQARGPHSRHHRF